jgi:hypothetical protein
MFEFLFYLIKYLAVEKFSSFTGIFSRSGKNLGHTEMQKPHQNIVTVACLFTHFFMHSFFLDAIEGIFNKDASLSIHPK